MARVLSDMSAAGPSSVQWAFLYLLQQLLVVYVCRPNRRGRLHARLRWEESVGGVDDGSAAADHTQLARNCHQMFFRVEWEEENTAGQISRALYRHPALSTWSVDEEDSADQNSASETLHGTETTSTALVNFVQPRSADSDSEASSSTKLDGSSNDEACSSTAEQPDRGDDMDDCDSMISTITTEELLVRQPDSNEEMDVSMAQEQASETGNGGQGTTSAPWWLIPGFRFSPTDREIVLHYLKRKVLNRKLPAHHTLEEGPNIYALDADEITLDGKYGHKEQLGFFFVHRHGYSNGCYYPTPDGYWRIRGHPAGVRHRGRTVAFKTAMDFYRGRPPHGCRTPWSMFEYALNGCHVDLLNLAQPWVHERLRCVQGSEEGEQNVGQGGEVASPRTVTETPFSQENIAETPQTGDDSCTHGGRSSENPIEAEGGRPITSRPVGEEPRVLAKKARAA
ncbi:unnamed protein product [Alopecurus aequalis]